MEFIQRSSPRGASSEQKIQLKRSVKVKKFDPTQVTPSSAKAIVDRAAHKPKSPPQLLAPQSSHVEVTPVDLPAPRWPPKPIKRKDIESKPWYMWTMEETTEYYMGDQIRAERYGTYNPSFVKKLDAENPSPKIAFGYKANGQNGNLTSKNLKASQSSSIGRTSQSRTATSKSSFAGNQSETMTVISSLSRNRSVHGQRDEVEREIRSRRLKYTDLVDELEEVRRQTEELEIRAEKEYGDVQAAIKAAENSDQEVKRAEMRAMQVIATTRLGVNKILQHRQGQQESLREMVERQKESLRRMSIRDAAGRKINPDDLLRSYEVPEFENPKLNEGNMAKYLHKLEAEKRKEQVKAAVRRGLKRFAAMQKMKKKNPQAAKKTVRLA